MRIATYEIKGERRVGVVQGEANDVVIDLEKAASITNSAGIACGDMLSLICSSSEDAAELAQLMAHIGEPSLAEARVRASDVKFLAPLNNPGKIICLAGNYREHITESGFVAPEQAAIITPQLFLKPSTSLIGDGDDIQLGETNVTVGWETELAVVIGQRGKEIPAQDAFEYVFGYTVLNDLSERRLNSQIENRHMRENDRFFDWLAGKWFDGFAPCGPWIVTRDEVPDPHNLEIRFFVNDQLRQQGNTGDMIFRIPETIAYISSIMTLEPGDIISTGTPAGAGVGDGGTSLGDGDRMRCEIEGVGTLHNKVRWVR